MDNNFSEFNSQPILYELIEYFVRKQEPEFIRCKNDTIILPTTGTIKNALRYLNNRYSLPESLSQHITLTLPWKFSIDHSGRLLGILQENVIEIRKSKDEFSSVLSKASVPKDAFSQWRKLSWSPDGSILVLASSNGYLSFYNSSGNNLFNINPKTISQSPEILEAGDAISSLTFHTPKYEPENWSYELLVMTYSGLLKSYNISTSRGFKENYEFSFGNFYRKGVNALVYDKHHNVYIIAGNSINQHSSSPASIAGLTSWRPINDYPHYKLTFAFEEKAGLPTFSLWNLIPKFRIPEEPVIFRMSISPNCNHLVCLHTDGQISLWNLPNMQLQKKWKLNEQPNYNHQNPKISLKQRKFPIGHSEYHPFDIGWWSDHSIIIARYSGAISICSIYDLKNLLGSSPEYLYGQPQILELHPNNGFLCLDCETIVTKKKSNNDPNNDGQSSEASDSEKEEDELEPLTFMNYVTNLLRVALYSITDIESFQPKRKKSKIVQRTYRIVGMKNTTPEELYSRKIDIEEYDEALALANAYNLDTDLVYQTQWRKSSFSLHAIENYLSKVRKRSWILNECVMRVPETLDAARELLNFGLKGANLQTLVAIGIADDGKITIDDTNNDDIAQFDDLNSNLRHIQRINENLKNVNLTALTNSQKELLLFRKKLLSHLDKLKTYEMIIENTKEYNKELYEKFRQLTLLENAVTFARDCNYRAVEIMLTYHGQKLMPHWLVIISCFPETLNPNEYEKLLPECDEQGQLFLLYQRELRPNDWLERNEFRIIFDDNEKDHSHVLYDSEPNLLIYRNSEITMELLQKWYRWRAYQIERYSSIVENAVELIRIGKAHNIIGLEDFLLELETLDDLIYKVLQQNISLTQFEKLSHIEKVKLLMSTATENNFVLHLKSYVLPYIIRKQKYLGGAIDKDILVDYLVTLSENDLTLPLKFFSSVPYEIDLLNLVDDIIELALNCIYACTNLDMYQTAKSIFETLPKLQPGTSSLQITNPMEELERELACLKILNKYNVSTTIFFIHKNKMNEDEVKLLLYQMSNNLNAIIPPPNQKKWAELLNDMLKLHEFIFTCINIEICFKICVQARLASGIIINIQNCASLIETKRTEHSLLKVSYNRAVALILQASRTYFDSSRSLNDPNMELSKACLHLIEDENPLIQVEYDLIYSLQILNEFHVNILPMQVRMNHDKLKLIENCLNSQRDAYKNQQRLLMLATYLRINGDNIRSREGKVLELIAEKAFEAEDYEYCSSICEKLIDNNYFIAWKIIQQLGCCEHYNDMLFKQKCLSFAMTYGPNEILEPTLDHMHLLEIQVLNKDLENWMTTREYEGFSNNESDDEFTDALTTPQIEMKELIPAILQTSTGLVKSSARLVKDSTIGILKNFSNQSFWKKEPKFDSTSISDPSNDSMEDINSQKYRNEVQSFPYFYQLIHSEYNVNISRIDTRYDTYYMPEVINRNLKIIQTLIRVALLSETSWYGSEMSDINPFLIKAADSIMPDDWLLGMAYLLCLPAANTSSSLSLLADEVFEHLARTNLFIQTAIYYYSLQLYREIHPHSTNYFLYDPMDLIHSMIAEANVVNNEVNYSATKKALIHWYKKISTNQMSEIKTTEAKNKIETLENSSENLNEIIRLNHSEQSDHSHEYNLITKNLYNNDTFKIIPENDINEASGWDDNWSDFSDHINNDVDKNFKFPSDRLDSETNTVMNTWPSSNERIEATDEENVHVDTSRISSQINCAAAVNNFTECQRFEIFEHLFSQIESQNDYIKLKQTMQMWPAFIDSEFTTIEKHPILRMIFRAKTFNGNDTKVKDDSKLQSATLQWYKELFVEQDISAECFISFIKQVDNSSNFTVEEKIFLRLCSNNPALHKESVEIIMNNSTTDYPLLIFEELFFKNLTSLFPPHHPIYNKIIEVIFLNHDLLDIESHIKELIQKLIEQKHIPYAIALWKQLATIPPALSTFDSCLQLFVRK